MENEATPRPWITSAQPSYKTDIGKRYYKNILYTVTKILAKVYGNTPKEANDNAELIVKAVNAYDALVEENQKLRSEIKERGEVTSAIINDKRKFADNIIQLQAEKAELVECLESILEDSITVQIDGRIKRVLSKCATKAKNV